MTVTQHLERLFADYARAFLAFDAERIASFYHVPCLLVSSQGVAWFESRKAVTDNMTALCEYHRHEGLHSPRIVRLRVTVLGPANALTTVDWQMGNAAGNAGVAFTNTYNLTYLDDSWKILVSTTHD